MHGPHWIRRRIKCALKGHRYVAHMTHEPRCIRCGKPASTHGSAIRHPH